MLLISVIIQVQERLPAQSNPWYEQSRSMFGSNKKLPEKESKLIMWTLKIKLLMSLPNVLRGHCFNRWTEDLDWYDQRKYDLSFLFCLTQCTVPHGGQLRNLVSPISVEDCLRTWKLPISHSKSQRRTFEEPNVLNSWISLQILIFRMALMRSNITNLKTVYYLHYRGSVHCNEQELGTFHMQSS